MFVESLPILLASSLSGVNQFQRPRIEMIIDDGTAIVNQKELYQSVQSCLRGTQSLFTKNAQDIKEAQDHKTAFPEKFRITRRRQMEDSSNFVLE